MESVSISITVPIDSIMLAEYSYPSEDNKARSFLVFGSRLGIASSETVKRDAHNTTDLIHQSSYRQPGTKNTHGVSWWIRDLHNPGLYLWMRIPKNIFSGTSESFLPDV